MEDLDNFLNIGHFYERAVDSLYVESMDPERDVQNEKEIQNMFEEQMATREIMASLKSR
jgi:hypothetical protein